MEARLMADTRLVLLERHLEGGQVEFPAETVSGLLAHAAALTARVAALEKERDEDQGVIRVWRGRTERAEGALRQLLEAFPPAGSDQEVEAIEHAQSVLGEAK